VMSWGYLQLSNTPQDAWIQSQKGKIWKLRVDE